MYIVDVSRRATETRGLPSQGGNRRGSPQGLPEKGARRGETAMRWVRWRWRSVSLSVHLPYMYLPRAFDAALT